MPVQLSESRAASLRAFDVVEVVAKSPGPITLDEIAALTGLPKPSAHRFLIALSEAQLLRRDALAKSYSVGPRLAELAISALTNAPLRTARHAILKGLVDEIGETCNFTTLDGGEVVYIERVESGWPLRLHLHPGSRVPIHCTSSGKLFLSQMPAQQRRRLLNGAPLKRYTAKTVIDPEMLERELRRIRRTKISTDDEGFLSGLISVAVPVFSRRNKILATVAVHAPSARLSLQRALRHVPLLQRAAEELCELYISLAANR